MPCPFPGMYPYLERPPFWGDFCPALLATISNALLSQLLPRYDVCIVESFIEDVRDLDEPTSDPRVERHLHIIHSQTQRLVTVVEVLSPGNKAPGEAGIQAYVAKRAEFLACRCNLVEIDLLRGGERLPMSAPLPPGDYYALIGRMDQKPRCQVMAWSLRSALPRIPIPLLPEDGETTLDLAHVFRTAYEPAFYDRRLPYHQPLTPPVAPRDTAWLAESLQAVSR